MTKSKVAAEKSSVFGAALLSACGAMPSHLMPMLLFMWLATGQASLQSAGTVAAAHSVGILSALLIVPAIGILHLRSNWLYGAAGLLLGALISSYWLSGIALLVAWGLAGVSAGVMQYFGSVVCSLASDQRAAFALRLAVSLFMAGCATLIVFGVQVIGWGIPLIWLVVLLEATALCFALYRLKGTSASRSAPPSLLSRKNLGIPSGGLLVLFLLFLGQVGFYVYVLQTVSSAGWLSPPWVAAALALAKLAASFILYSLIRQGRDLVSRLGFTGVACILIAAVLLLGQAHNWLFVVLGFVLWELCFNVLVAAFQGELAKKHPTIVGMWGSVPVFLGAAAGPVIHGWLLGQGWGTIFILLAVLSALGPVLWVRLSRIQPA